MQSAREKDTGEAYTGPQKDAGETSNDTGKAYTRNSPSEVDWPESRIAWAGQTIQAKPINFPAIEVV